MEVSKQIASIIVDDEAYAQAYAQYITRFDLLIQFSCTITVRRSSGHQGYRGGMSRMGKIDGCW